MIAVTPDGQRSMNTFLGACREVVSEDVDEKEVARARILYIEGYLWDEESAKQASRKAIAAVRSAGGRIALTLSDAFCVGRFRDEFLQLLDKDVNILFANEDEAKALFEAEDFADVVKAAQKWGGIAALTRSAKGCVVVEDGVVHEIAAAPVARVVDTTGAGDQFAAGFLYGLTHGKGLADCGRLGALAAAEVISHYGARPETSLEGIGREGRADLVANQMQHHFAPVRRVAMLEQINPLPGAQRQAGLSARECRSRFASARRGHARACRRALRRYDDSSCPWWRVGRRNRCKSFCTSGSAFS